MLEGLAASLRLNRDAPEGRLWLLRLAKRLYFDGGQRSCLAWLRVGQYAQACGVQWLAQASERAIERRFSCYISMKASIGSHLSLPHPVGIVIGRGAVIGDNCTLYQHVTLGMAKAGKWSEEPYPAIAAGVTCYAGAIMLGAIRVGRGAVVGANAVVLQSIPSGAVAVGVPARILGHYEHGARERSARSAG